MSSSMPSRVQLRGASVVDYCGREVTSSLFSSSPLTPLKCCCWTMTAFEDTLPSPPGNPDTPFSYPLAHPDPSAKPVAPKELSPDQLAKLDRLVDHFNKPDFRLPRTLRALKARWAKEQGGGGSRFGGLFSRSSTPTNEEVRIRDLLKT